MYMNIIDFKDIEDCRGNVLTWEKDDVTIFELVVKCCKVKKY